MSNVDDVMRVLKRMDVLRVRIDSVTSTKAERQEYARLRRAVEARLNVRADGPRRAMRRGAETERRAA